MLSLRFNANKTFLLFNLHLRQKHIEDEPLQYHDSFDNGMKFFTAYRDKRKPLPVMPPFEFPSFDGGLRSLQSNAYFVVWQRLLSMKIEINIHAVRVNTRDYKTRMRAMYQKKRINSITSQVLEPQKVSSWYFKFR